MNYETYHIMNTKKKDFSQKKRKKNQRLMTMWGDIENNEISLPESYIIGPIDGIKTVITFRINNGTGLKEKVSKIYKVETKSSKKSPSCVSIRKTWKKFGDAANDPPGAQLITTTQSEDVFIVPIDSNQVEVNEDSINLLDKQLSCRHCHCAHFTSKCPYKAIRTFGIEDSRQGESAMSLEPYGRNFGEDRGTRDGTSLCAVEAKQEISRESSVRQSTDTLRVSNLSEETHERDLRDLFSKVGFVSRIHLNRDKVTGRSKGFGFVSYQRPEDAAIAIEKLNGFGYDHLILSVEWANRIAGKAR